MFIATDYKDINKLKNPIFIDVRTRKEHDYSTIPGAVNLPVLDDEERKQVGIEYKQGSHLQAKMMGIEFVSRKLPMLTKEIINYKNAGHDIVLFCSRGGYRSSALFHLLNALQIECFKLHSGYKGYRQYVWHGLPEMIDKFTYVNLNGNTGTGKTNILMEIEKMGGQVLDLEGLANHRGSLLGHIGLGGQPSQKMFESLIYHRLEEFDKPLVFIESESVKIGHLKVPSKLYQAYRESPHQVVVSSPLATRVRRIREEYIGNSVNRDTFFQELEEGLQRIEGYIKKDIFNEYYPQLQHGEYDNLIEDLIVKYYDVKYKSFEGEIDVHLENIDSHEAAVTLLNHYSSSNSVSRVESLTPESQ